MNRALIVEDDRVQLENLREALHRTNPLITVCTASDYEDAIRKIHSSLADASYYSLFLLDIQLTVNPSDRGGFKIADFIRKHKCYYTAPILFLTSIKNDIKYALNHYHCYNYITKPYTVDDIIYELKQMALTGLLQEHTLVFSDINGIQYHISLHDIIYIHVKSHVLNLYTTHGSIYTRKYSLTSIQEKLDNNFIRCHKSYILNMNHIINYDKVNHFVTIGDKSIPVSRTYASSFDTNFSQHKI